MMLRLPTAAAALWLTAVGLPTLSAPTADVTAHLLTQRTIGDVSELDRARYFNIHGSYDSVDLTGADLDLLTKHLRVGFGRAFCSPFYYYDGGPPYPDRKTLDGLVTFAHDTIKGATQWPYLDRNVVITEHPRVAFRPDDDFDEAAGFAADFFETHYPQGARPRYYEPMNEPFVHAGDFGDDQDAVRRAMTRWLAAIGKAFDDRGMDDVSVVGYASAWPSMELWDFKHWRERMKMFMDVAGPHMDAISVHLYDGTNVTGQDNRRSGSNADAILDLVETYGATLWGTPKPHALTEYGDIPKGFGKAYSDAAASAHLNSLNHLLFGFLERPDRIAISIPFITAKSPWFYNLPENNFEPYSVDLWRPDPDRIVDGVVKGFLTTPKIHFYELWQDVQGHRVAIASSEPDLAARAFVSGADAFVCLNNFEEHDVATTLHTPGDLPALSGVQVKRLYVAGKQAAAYTVEEHDNAPATLTVRPHESVIIRYRFAAPLAPTAQQHHHTLYSQTMQVPIVADEPIDFTFDGVDAEAPVVGASLRMALGRKHDRTKEPVVTFNGEAVPVPSDWIGYDQTNREDFFGAIEIPVPAALIRAENQVTLTFPDAEGRVSTLILTIDTQK